MSNYYFAETVNGIPYEVLQEAGVDYWFFQSEGDWDSPLTDEQVEDFRSYVESEPKPDLKFWRTLGDTVVFRGTEEQREQVVTWHDTNGRGVRITNPREFFAGYTTYPPSVAHNPTSDEERQQTYDGILPAWLLLLPSIGPLPAEMVNLLASLIVVGVIVQVVL